jgi:hypothetical protein
MRDAVLRVMFSLLSSLFGRRSRRTGLFGRRSNNVGRTIGNHPRGIALGTLASIAAPFIARKLMARRQQRAYGPGY